MNNLNNEEHNNEEHDLAIINKHLTLLSEHFDSIHIFATRYEPNKGCITTSINNGIGNWFSRFGFIKSWIIRCEETERENSRKYE